MRYFYYTSYEPSKGRCQFDWHVKIQLRSMASWRNPDLWEKKAAKMRADLTWRWTKCYKKYIHSHSAKKKKKNENVFLQTRSIVISFGFLSYMFVWQQQNHYIPYLVIILNSERAPIDPRIYNTHKYSHSQSESQTHSLTQSNLLNN